MLLLILFPLKVITEVHLNDLNGVTLGNRVFLSFQFSYPGSRVSLLHFLEDMSCLKSLEYIKNRENVVSVKKMVSAEILTSEWTLQYTAIRVSVNSTIAVRFQYIFITLPSWGIFLLGKVYLKCYDHTL